MVILASALSPDSTVEMVIMDGQAFQVRGTGQVSIAAPDAGTPFAIVTRFSPQVDTGIAAVDDLRQPAATL